MKRIRFAPLYAVVILLCLCLFSSVQVQAQDNLFISTYSSKDGSFRFQYPVTWEIDERDDGTLTLGRADMSLWIIPPDQLTYFGDKAADARTASALMDAFMQETEGQFEFGSPKKVELLSGGVGLQAALKINDESVPADTEAFAFAFPVGDTFAIILGITGSENIDALTVVAYMVGDSFEVGEFSTPDAVTGSLPTLQYIGSGVSANDWHGFVTELVALDLIPPGGEAVYEKDMTISGLEPGTNLGDDSASEYTDFAMGALISLRVLNEGDNAICGLITRATKTQTGDLNTFFAVGATEHNTVVVIDFYDRQSNPFLYETDVLDVDFHDPQHLLYILRDNQLTAFVNGEAVIEALPVPPLPADVPTRAGVNLDPGCVMTSVWAVGLPSAQIEATAEATAGD